MGAGASSSTGALKTDLATSQVPKFSWRVTSSGKARCVQLGSDLQTVYVDGAEINDREHSFASNGVKINFKLDLKSCTVTVTHGDEPKVTLEVNNEVVEPTQAVLPQKTASNRLPAALQRAADDALATVSTATVNVKPLSRPSSQIALPNGALLQMPRRHLPKSGESLNLKIEEEAAWRRTIMGRLNKPATQSWKCQHRKVVLRQLRNEAQEAGMVLEILDTVDGEVAVQRAVATVADLQQATAKSDAALRDGRLDAAEAGIQDAEQIREELLNQSVGG